ncbi:hypothetical protein D3C76_1378350 [compost metagenome]
MQGLGQLGTFLFLHRQQGLGQPGIIATSLFQRDGHAVEMRRQLPRLRPPFWTQAHCELSGTHLLERPQQLIEQTHATTHRPADGQQTDHQGHRTQAEQLLHGVPDFVDFIPWIKRNLHPSAIRQIEDSGAMTHFGEQQAAQPGIEPALHG